MSLKMKKVLISWFFGLFLVFAAITGAQAYSDVLSFGDSLSDNGKVDGYGIRQFSNGKVWVEYLAGNLNVSLTDMAYGGAVSGQNDPYAWKSVYDGTLAATGSTAAATYNANASGYDSQYGLQWQVGEYINNVKGSSNISNTLITMTAGGNDFFNYYYASVLGTPFSPQAAIDNTAGLYDFKVAAANVAAAVSALIGAGGKNFLIQNLAMPGNDWATAFNYYLGIYLANIGVANPDANIMILDMNKFVATVDNPTGTFLDNLAACTDSDDSTVCKSGTFAWWDQENVHPTTEVHEQIAAYAWKTAVPEPASILLMILGFAGLAGARRRMK